VKNNNDINNNNKNNILWLSLFGVFYCGTNHLFSCIALSPYLISTTFLSTLSSSTTDFSIDVDPRTKKNGI